MAEWRKIMLRIPYNLEINNSRDHDMLCELLAKAREDYEDKKEDAIIELLKIALDKINVLSVEVAGLRATISANTPSSEEASITPETKDIKDDLYSVINASSSINYTEKTCEEMEKHYIEYLLKESNTHNKNMILRRYLAPTVSLRRFAEASINDLAKIRSIGRPTAKQLRAYLDEKFGKSERLFSPEIVQEIKKVYLQYLSVKGNVGKIIERYPSFEELAQTSKKELLLLSDETSVEKFCIMLEVKFDIKIRD